MFQEVGISLNLDGSTNEIAQNFQIMQYGVANTFKLIIPLLRNISVVCQIR
jgi:hypothetical protein